MRRIWLAVLLLLLAACRSSSTAARSAAEGFLDEHYVHINLEAAKQHCVGVARFKVEEEQRLVGDQQIDASTRRPRVTYSLAETKDEAEDRATFVYAANVHFDDGGDTALRWLVTVRREGDGSWKVSNYQEFE